MTRGKTPVRLTGLTRAHAAWRTTHPQTGELPAAFGLAFRQSSGPGIVGDGRELFAALTPAELAEVLGAVPALSLTGDDEDIRSLLRVTNLLEGKPAPRPGTWTVIGAWVEDQAIVTGTIPGTHSVYGGDDYDAFPQGCWATSATAPDASTAESIAVDEMMATLDHDDESEPQP